MGLPNVAKGEHGTRTAAEALMTKALAAAEPGMRLPVAHALMVRMCVHHLPVVDAKNHVVGILSDRDVPVSLRPDGSVFVDPALTVGDAMTPIPFVVGPTTPLRAIAGLMLAHRIDGVPIVSNGQLVGLITATDLVAWVASAPAPA